MKNRMIAFVLSTAALVVPALALTIQTETAYAQAPSGSPLLLPPQVEKELAAKATNATEVTLNKEMLGFASKFMNGKDQNQAAVGQLIQGLDGIYVRDYEFDKEGEYSMEDIEKVRQAIETPEWTPMVRDVERKGAEINDVMVKMVNGENKGMFILSAEPKEISIVLILGSIRMDQLGMLKGIGGLGALGDVEKNTKHMNKDDKDKDKDKSKDKGGDQ
jgi:uncharacterized protein DUF4252